MAPQLTHNLALETAANVGPAAARAPDARAELAAQFIPAGSRVLDLGADTALARFLPSGCSYLGRDRVTCDRGQACDIAGGDFPTHAAAQSDIIVMLGALEHIADAENLFTHLRFRKQDVILSYRATDLVAGSERAALGLANAFSFYDLALLFDRYGFRIECTAPMDGGEMLMRLTPTERLRPIAPCSVAVISDSNFGSFAGRLGCQMINALTPGEADVHHLYFDSLQEARDKYDLVVLGLGTSLFQPLLGDDVLDVVGRGKAAIGIFGTHYRELIPRPSLERLLDRLDTWFARYEDDVLTYGSGRSNVSHLGDWLIDQFPMRAATLDEPLQIAEEVRVDHALDRAIQVIQCHKYVYSIRQVPLLCALTAAENVAYAEPPSAQMPGLGSGEFRSMLIDIFGRSYPEKQFFAVDRDAVRRYKARVHRNIAAVRERIDSILRNVAVAAV
ncbi:MAG: hypothetical protein ACREB2_01805 [Pseudolabrys sp.]